MMTKRALMVKRRRSSPAANGVSMRVCPFHVLRHRAGGVVIRAAFVDSAGARR